MGCCIVKLDKFIVLVSDPWILMTVLDRGSKIEIYWHSKNRPWYCMAKIGQETLPCHTDSSEKSAVEKAISRQCSHIGSGNGIPCQEKVGDMGSTMRYPSA